MQGFRLQDYLRKDSVRKLGEILCSLLIAFIVGAVVLLAIQANPITVYQAIFSKALLSFDTVLRRATVLMLAGLAVAVPLKSGMFNMGGEGQIIAGALTAAVIGSTDLGIPGALQCILAIAGALLVGAVLSALPAVLKTKRGASEVVTTLMLNTIIANIVTYLVMNPFRGAEYSPQTATVLEGARIPRFFGMSFSWGLFLAVALCILANYLMQRTSFGLELRSAGLNPVMAGYQGVNIRTMGIIGMVIGGALAAGGGALEVLGGQYIYQNDYFANYGFDGIAIAYMANNNPLAIILTSIIISMIRTGALTVSRQTGMSVYFVTLLQGLIILLLVVPGFSKTLANGWNALFHRRKGAIE